MRKFLKSFLYFLIPMIIAIGLYILLDPFKVIKSYDVYINTQDAGRVVLNKDFVSTSNFDHNYKRIKYNSFIFGNSRSIFYQISDWEKHIPQDSHCYHFDASGESLYSLQKKIQYIDSKNLNIQNVLLILDYSTLIADKPKSGHLFIISPQLLGYTNTIEFHLAFLKAFFTPRFFYAFLDYKLTGEIRPYMTEGHLLDDRPMSYDAGNNEIRFDYFEDLIFKDEYYSPKRLLPFYERGTIQTYSPAAIKENQRKLLNDICKIFTKHKTNFKIIISPLYNQVKLNPEDIGHLMDIFGERKVFDFSGINSFTNDYRNYYEDSHYRPFVARKIMDEIYENE